MHTTYCNKHTAKQRHSMSSVIAIPKTDIKGGGYFVIVLDPNLPVSQRSRKTLVKHNNSTAPNSQLRLAKIPHWAPPTAHEPGWKIPV